MKLIRQNSGLTLVSTFAYLAKNLDYLTKSLDYLTKCLHFGQQKL